MERGRTRGRGSAGASPASEQPTSTSEAVPDTIGRRCRVHLLDVGRQQYGDCILLQFGGEEGNAEGAVTVLIDGAHPGDFVSSGPGHFSIPAQLRFLTGTPAGEPVVVDLLVITHCHSDHYGCLPTLVETDQVRARWALLADPDLGFGKVSEGDMDVATLAGLPATVRRVVAALREETLDPDADDEQILALLDAADGIFERYQRMMELLEERGATIVRYGVDDHAPLVEQFAQQGLTIGVLGPTRAQLDRCAEVIRDGTEGVRDAALAMFDLSDDAAREDEAGQAAAFDEIAAYRELAVGPSLTDADRNVGAALNDQSILLRFAFGGRNLLLTGDMQFELPEVAGLGDEMAALIEAVRAHGPYDFVKISHHASNDSFGDDFFRATGEETRHFGFTTGSGSKNHPSADARELLDANADRIRWARTDRNGQVSITFPADGGEPEIRLQRGQLNDASGPAGRRGGRGRRPLGPEPVEDALPSAVATGSMAAALPEEGIMQGALPVRGGGGPDAVEISTRVERPNAPHFRLTFEYTALSETDETRSSGERAGATPPPTPAMASPAAHGTPFSAAGEGPALSAGDEVMTSAPALAAATAATVVIDPGHGGSQTVGGSSPNNAVSPSGVLEKAVTLQLGKLTRDALLAQAPGRGVNLTVVMTRTADMNVGIRARAQKARSSKAQRFLSIHFNGDQGRARGVETFFRAAANGNVNLAEDKAFARRIQSALVAAWRQFDPSTPDRGVKPDTSSGPGSLGVLSDVWLGNTTASHPCRAVLTEVEFLDTRKIDTLLNRGSNAEQVRKALAAALARAILDDLLGV